MCFASLPIHPHPHRHPSASSASTSQGLADAVRVPRLFLSLSPSWRLASFRFIIFCCGDGAYALDGRERRPLQTPFRYTQPCSASLLSCPRGRRGIPAATRPGPSLAGERRSLRLPMAWPRSTPRRRIWGSSECSEKPFGLRRWTSSATKLPESSNLFAVCEFSFQLLALGIYSFILRPEIEFSNKKC